MFEWAVLPKWSAWVIIICGCFIMVVLENMRQKKVAKAIAKKKRDDLEKRKVIKNYSDYRMVTTLIGEDGKPIGEFTTWQDDFQFLITEAFRRMHGYPFELGQRLMITLEPNEGEKLWPSSSDVRSAQLNSLKD
jgi:hypothetical protein